MKTFEIKDVAMGRQNIPDMTVKFALDADLLAQCRKAQELVGSLKLPSLLGIVLGAESLIDTLQFFDADGDAVDLWDAYSVQVDTATVDVHGRTCYLEFWVTGCTDAEQVCIDFTL